MTVTDIQRLEGRHSQFLLIYTCFRECSFVSSAVPQRHVSHSVEGAVPALRDTVSQDCTTSELGGSLEVTYSIAQPTSAHFSGRASLTGILDFNITRPWG